GQFRHDASKLPMNVVLGKEDRGCNPSLAGRNRGGGFIAGGFDGKDCGGSGAHEWTSTPQHRGESCHVPSERLNWVSGGQAEAHQAEKLKRHDPPGKAPRGSSKPQSQHGSRKTASRDDGG